MQSYLSFLEKRNTEAVERAVCTVDSEGGWGAICREDLFSLAGRIYDAQLAYLRQAVADPGEAGLAPAVDSLLRLCREIAPRLMGHGCCLPDAVKLAECLRNYILEKLDASGLPAEAGAGGVEELRDLTLDSAEAVNRALCSIWSPYCTGRFCLESVHPASTSLGARPGGGRAVSGSGSMLPKDIERLEVLSEFAGGLAHDYNNLMTGILGGADMALEELPAESEVRSVIEGIRRSALEAVDLTGQVLAFSGGRAGETRVADLSQVTKEMDGVLRSMLTENVSLTYDFASTLPPAEIQVGQVRQVILSLVRNGVEAMRDGGGTLCVSTGSHLVDRNYLAGTLLDESLPDGRYVFLQVSDSGPGIDPVTQERMFDPCFTTKESARGLGLSAVLGVVRSHGGTLKVYTEEAEGTSVKLLFPEAVSRPEDDAVSVRSVPRELMHGTILVVDDEKSVVDVCRRILESRGFRVLTAEDGQEGLESFGEHADEIDLVILDMIMPRMDARGAFREMRRISRDIPVILMSGYTRRGALASFHGKGLAGFLQKPFRREDLLSAVGRALGREE